MLHRYNSNKKKYIPGNHSPFMNKIVINKSNETLKQTKIRNLLKVKASKIGKSTKINGIFVCRY